MGGGSNPFEAILAPFGKVQSVAELPGRAIDAPLPPAISGNPRKAQEDAADAAEAQRIRNQNLLLDQQSKAEQDLNARTETPQEALDARRRAQAASTALAGGQRRASQTLTTPGMSLSGSY